MNPDITAEVKEVDFDANNKAVLHTDYTYNGVVAAQKNIYVDNLAITSAEVEALIIAQAPYIDTEKIDADIALETTKVDAITEILKAKAVTYEQEPQVNTTAEAV